MRKLACIAVIIASLAVAVFAHGNLEHILGTVVAVTDHTVSVKTADGSVKIVAFDSETQFLKGVSPAAAKDLAVGIRVVIHAHKNGEKFHAAEIKMAAAAAGQHP